MSDDSSQESNALGVYASRAMKKMRDLAASESILDRMVLLNAILLTVDLGFLVTHLVILKDSFFSLASLLILALMFVLAFILAMVVYHPVADALIKIGKNSLFALRISAYLMLVCLPLAVASTVFNNDYIAYTGFGIIGLHFLVLLSGAFIAYPNIESTTNEKGRGWTILGNFGTLVGIISSIGSIVMLFFGKT